MHIALSLMLLTPSAPKLLLCGPTGNGVEVTQPAVQLLRPSVKRTAQQAELFKAQFHKSDCSDDACCQRAAKQANAKFYSVAQVAYDRGWWQNRIPVKTADGVQVASAQAGCKPQLSCLQKTTPRANWTFAATNPGRTIRERAANLHRELDAMAAGKGKLKAPKNAKKLVSLSVTSSPNAALQVDGEATCERTPCRVITKPGKRQLSASASRHSDTQQTINAKNDIAVDLALDPLFGTLEVRSQVAADILVNGTSQGNASDLTLELDAGDYTIEARPKCHEPRLAQITVRPGQLAQSVFADFKTRRRAIRVNAQTHDGLPVQANLSVDGTALGQGPGPHNVDHCAQVLTVQAGKYTEQVTLNPNQSTYDVTLGQAPKVAMVKPAPKPRPSSPPKPMAPKPQSINLNDNIQVAQRTSTLTASTFCSPGIDDRPYWINEPPPGYLHDYFVGQAEAGSPVASKKAAIASGISAIVAKGLITVETLSNVAQRAIAADGEEKFYSDITEEVRVKGHSESIQGLEQVEFHNEQCGQVTRTFALVRIPKKDPKEPPGAGSLFLRSLVPGWAQFYKSNDKRGWFFLISEAILIPTAAITWTVSAGAADDLAASRKQAERDFFEERRDRFYTISLVTGAIAGAVYVYNIIDGIAAPGRKVYVDAAEPDPDWRFAVLPTDTGAYGTLQLRY